MSKFDEEKLASMIETWMEFCGHLTGDQFESAVKWHLGSQEAKWPLAPPTLLAAYRGWLEEPHYNPLEAGTW